MVDPVCPLERNLCGDPLAGLLWERHLEEALFKMNCEKLQGWECLYVHREQQLFVSVYVDDFKIMGKVEKISKMWKRMRKEIDLEPETELSDNVYLGCNQRLTVPNERLLQEKNELFKKLTTHEKADAEGDLSAAGDRGSVKEARERQPGESKIQELANDDSSAQYPPTCLERTIAWNYDMIGHAEQCV